MSFLNSDRLRLVPLTYTQLDLLINDRPALETSLGLLPSPIEIGGDGSFQREFDEATRSFTLPALAAHPDRFEWYTLWLIIHREENRIAGGIGMVGPPNEQGEVMIGYFINLRLEGRGCATEAVGCLAQWIFRSPDATCVIADTLTDGFASQRVLQKNGFVRAGEVEEGIRWRKLR